MNIRKAVDYSAMFAALEAAMDADLPQMELYCEIGKIVCARSEKGAAVAAAEFLKEKRSGILADNNEQSKANQRIMDAAQTLENASPYITEWDESAVRQLVETAKVLSKDEIAVTLKGGMEIRQKIVY